MNVTDWVGLMPNADRVAIDSHAYFAFNGQANTQPVNVAAADGGMGGIWPGLACSAWKESLSTRYATSILSTFFTKSLTDFFPAKSNSASLSAENTVLASTIAAST